MSATTEYLERQSVTMLELIKEKDELINRLREEVSVQSNRVSNMRLERGNLVNEVKDYVFESLANGEMSDTVAETLAQICDFELTKEVIATVTVTYEIQMNVPVNEDAESLVHDIDFESLSYNSDHITYLTADVGDVSIDSQGAMKDIPNVFKLGKGPEHGHVNCSKPIPLKNVDPPILGLSSYDDVIKITGKMSDLPYDCLA